MTEHLVPEKTARKMGFSRGLHQSHAWFLKPTHRAQRTVRKPGQRSRVPTPVNSCSWCLKWSLSPTLLGLHPFVKHGSVTENNPQGKENTWREQYPIPLTSSYGE